MKPDELRELRIPSLHVPNLSILRDGQWVDAPNNISPDDPNVARIFDVQAITDPLPEDRCGRIPLTPLLPDYNQQRYWRLPIDIGVILSVLMAHANYSHRAEEIRLALFIRGRLTLQMFDHKGQNKAAHGRGDGDDAAGGSSDVQKRKRPKRDDDAGGRSKRRRKGRARNSSTRKSAPNSNAPMDPDEALSSSDSDGVSPEDWQFGPSLSTNEIIFASRARILF